MSAPVSSGTDINAATPIKAIIKAPRNALPKPLTSKPGTSADVSMIIKALMTNANRPKVKTDSGAVNNQSKGRIKAFIKPSTMAASRKAIVLSAFIPEMKSVAKPRPMAVASHVISKAVIVNSLV